MLFWFVVAASCGRSAPPSSPLTPITSGTLTIAGLSAPVRVIRDRWGIPHIYAETTADLFVAQGFVQAEDRLFQMDLWRRASLGRLSEVLGSNFVDRDGMTRRMQYAAVDLSSEWSSYAPDAHAIASAFVRGVNAWAARAHDRPPEEFRLAGWTPAFWSDTDLLNRTDAFRASGDALDDVRRLGLNDVVADAIRLVGPPPIFAALAAPVGAFRSVRLEQDAAGPLPAPAGIASADSWRVSADGRGTLTASEAPRALEVPARRYIVHLHAPGWNVIGLASPWLPGVITGHNERIAWGSVPTDADTQDVFVVRADAGAIERVVDTIRVKGRPAAQAFERNTTRSGVVVATDRDHDSVITVRWSGSEPGTAAELAAMTIDRAETPEQMRAALARWKLPARRFVFADVDGRVEFHDAALIPRRVGGNWSGWLPFADLAHGSPPKIDAHGPQSPSTAHADRGTFAHVLGITPAARARFNVGPFAPPSDGASPIRVVFDTRDWDRSQGMVAPGEGEFADGPHYADLGRAWSKGELVPLVFSDEAVRRNAAETLSLVPAIR